MMPSSVCLCVYLSVLYVSVDPLLWFLKFFSLDILWFQRDFLNHVFLWSWIMFLRAVICWFWIERIGEPTYSPDCWSLTYFSVFLLCCSTYSGDALSWHENNPFIATEIISVLSWNSPTFWNIQGTVWEMDCPYRRHPSAFLPSAIPGYSFKFLRFSRFSVIVFKEWNRNLVCIFRDNWAAFPVFQPRWEAR